MLDSGSRSVNWEFEDSDVDFIWDYIRQYVRQIWREKFDAVGTISTASVDCTNLHLPRSLTIFTPGIRLQDVDDLATSGGVLSVGSDAEGVI